ncbi:hypothetical protein JQN42_24220, partial [Escherichia coli]|uniref:hypothetical protein n=1 Tax=Escherichia coli TaxID=562 RepID=UPI0019396865
MSVLDFLSSGGMASIGGDLSEEEQKHTNEIVKLFAKKLREYARTLQIPAYNIKINKCSFLFVAKDDFSYHFVFADKPGGDNNLVYSILSEYRQLDIPSIVIQVLIYLVDVVWTSSCPD